MVISSRGRVALAVTLTILVIGGAIVLTLLRVQRWNELGWAGLNYLQSDLPEKGIWGMKPGGVVMAHPDAPAGRAGLRQGDILLKIDGVELKDLAGLRRSTGVCATVT